MIRLANAVTVYKKTIIGFNDHNYLFTLLRNFLKISSPFLILFVLRLMYCRDVACYVSTRPYFFCTFKKNEYVMFRNFLILFISCSSKIKHLTFFDSLDRNKIPCKISCWKIFEFFDNSHNSEKIIF